MRIIRAILGAVALVSAPQAARAEWLRASSANFVIYADDSERELRRFSERLERYHSAMAWLTQRHLEPPSPSNRVTVYVVRNETMVRKLVGEGARYVQGFYIPRAGGSLAIIPPVESVSGTPNFSMIRLLHEYAHHFAISANNQAVPRWLSEGQAEFFSSAKFESDGTVGIGMAANHRAGELFHAVDVKVTDLLDPEAYDRRRRQGYDAFYGKSWLLYHFLSFEPSRDGQLLQYLKLLNKGKSQRDAAVEAFGDLDKLEKDLARYLRQPAIQSFRVPASVLQVAPVAVHRLSAGEAAMMPVTIRSRRGVNLEQAKQLVVEARAIAGRFPNDPAVLSTLAEAEHDADNGEAAIAAADAAIALDPGQINAHVQKALALFSLAEGAPDKSVAYRRARMALSALNRREVDHPLPLIYYYKSFAAQGQEPPPLAIDGLMRASEVAPFDFGVRVTLGVQLIKVGRQAEARIVLAPVAFNPHGGGLAEAARKLLDRLDAEPNWNGAGIEAMAPAAEVEENEPA